MPRMHLNLAWLRASDSGRFLNSTRCWRHGLFWQTCQNILWFCKHGQKGRNRTAKSLFSA